MAYWWYSDKSCARGAAIAWNLFGMADLIDAVTLGTLSGAGIVFPAVLIPIYGVPREFVIHSYSLIGLLRKHRSNRCQEKRSTTGSKLLPHRDETSTFSRTLMLSTDRMIGIAANRRHFGGTKPNGGSDTFGRERAMRVGE